MTSYAFARANVVTRGKYGGTARWKSGRPEGWKIGRVEGWKIADLGFRPWIPVGRDSGRPQGTDFGLRITDYELRVTHGFFANPEARPLFDNRIATRRDRVTRELVNQLALQRYLPIGAARQAAGGVEARRAAESLAGGESRCRFIGTSPRYQAPRERAPAGRQCRADMRLSAFGETCPARPSFAPLGLCHESGAFRGLGLRPRPRLSTHRAFGPLWSDMQTSRSGLPDTLNRSALQRQLPIRSPAGGRNAKCLLEKNVASHVKRNIGKNRAELSRTEQN